MITVYTVSLCLKKNLNASKPSNQSKGLDGNIDCRDKSSTLTVHGIVHGIRRVGRISVSLSETVETIELTFFVLFAVFELLTL